MDILNMALSPHSDAMVSRVGDEAVILHLTNSTYYGLDPLGLKIWEGLEEGRCARMVCEDICRIFDAEIDIVEADARTFLAELITHGLLVEV